MSSFQALGPVVISLSSYTVNSRIPQFRSPRYSSVMHNWGDKDSGGHLASKTSKNTLNSVTHALKFTPADSYGRDCSKPLPIPQCPWSHISVDFMTDLPESRGFTTIPVIIDRFSKVCKLIPLKGLPTAMETAMAIFDHIFQDFELPEDIVSDRETQFTSQVWRAFCSRLGIKVSLTSSYHPQSNGQVERLN